jgi:F-type H+-transporting ATPase subunit delta
VSERNELYADAFMSLIWAEGNANEVADELFRLARSIEANDELRTTLEDQTLPVARRLQIVEDLLDGRAHTLTTSLVSLVVANGRLREFTGIVDKLVALSASRTNRRIAEVRSAIPLDDDQKRRLAEALTASTGIDVEVVVVVDPSVVGGIVTQIGDTVIDGSVRSRLSQLRENF